MKFLILNTDYPEFLHWLYAQHPGLEKQSYQEQLQVRYESLFGVADFYSSNLRKLGHGAWDIHLNNEALQRAWAAENGVTLPAPRRSLQFRLRRGLVPWAAVIPDQTWMRSILSAQIKHYEPDVVLNQDLRMIDAQFLRQADASIRLVIGQHAAPLSKSVNLRGYDLMLSSLPNFVSRFRRAGLRAELHRLAFEPRILKVLHDSKKDISASFVGTLSRSHRSRIALLTALSKRTPLLVWGPGVRDLPARSPIHARHRGVAWGQQMYEVLRASALTINHHIGIAEQFANNMRLFEATGVGTLLITDRKQNLHEMFTPDKEVVTYRSPIECGELIEYYLAHEQERAAIARAGQQRTLKEHTYEVRMQELVAIVNHHI
jgi:spore maturation protein CgeB